MGGYCISYWHRDVSSKFVALKLVWAVGSVNLQLNSTSLSPEPPAAEPRGSCLSRGHSITAFPGDDGFDLARGRTCVLHPVPGRRTSVINTSRFSHFLTQGKTG